MMFPAVFLRLVTSRLPSMILPAVLLLMTSRLPSTTARMPAWLSSPLQADSSPADRVGGDGINGQEAVAACRASCGYKFLQWPAHDGQCLDERQCVTCWRLCDLLYKAELKWRMTCVMDDCLDGCQTACNFDFSRSYGSAVAGEWQFVSDPVITTVDDQTLHVTWTPPDYRSQGFPTPPPGGRPIVYTLLFSEANNAVWHRATSTMNLKATVEGPHASIVGLRFQLLASSTEGTVSRVFMAYPGTAHIQPRPITPSTASTTTLPPPPTPTSRPSVMTAVRVDVQVTVDGSLEAIVTWGQKLTTPEGVVYTVSWGRHSCNVDPRLTFCPLQEDLLTANIKAKDREEMRVVLTQLTFNSKYRLQVSLQGRIHTSTFYTPACRQVDATFMRCAEEAPPSVSPQSPTTATSTGSWLTVGRTAARALSETLTTPRNRDGVKTSLDQSAGPMSWLSTNWLVVVIAAGVSVTSIVVVMAVVCIYRCLRAKRYSGSWHPDMSFVGGTTPYGSQYSLHHLKSYSALPQRLLAHYHTTSLPQLQYVHVLSNPPRLTICGTPSQTYRTIQRQHSFCQPHAVEEPMLQSFQKPRNIPQISIELCSDDEDQGPTRTSTPQSPHVMAITEKPLHTHRQWKSTDNISRVQGTPATTIRKSAQDIEHVTKDRTARRQLEFKVVQEVADMPATSWKFVTSFGAPTPATSYNQLCFIHDDSSDEEPDIIDLPRDTKISDPVDSFFYVPSSSMDTDV